MLRHPITFNDSMILALYLLLPDGPSLLSKLQKYGTCADLIRPHVVCPHCGRYQQRQIVTVNAGM